MIAKATVRYVRISSQKARLVADMIRGKNAMPAMTQLNFTPKKAARVIGKLLKSAVSNADQKGDVDKDNLFIKTIMVNDGPIVKRMMPRARGTANRISKRTSHITIVLEER